MERNSNSLTRSQLPKNTYKEGKREVLKLKLKVHELSSLSNKTAAR